MAASAGVDMSTIAGNGPCATCGREHSDAWRPRHPYVARVRVGEPLTVREAAKQRQPLDGADAQALEGALAATERERDAARLVVRTLDDAIDHCPVCLAARRNGRLEHGLSCNVGRALLPIAEENRSDEP